MKSTTIVIALIALGAGAFLADRMLADPSPNGEETTGATPAPTTGAGKTSSASNRTRPMPAITLAGLEQATISLSDFEGRPLLVNFWATWCRPCRKEIPLLIALREAHADQGLEIIGIAIDELEPTREMAASFGINYPVMVGEQEGIDAMVAFGAPTTALPFTAAVDRDGQIVAGHVGELTEEEAQRLLAALL